MVEKETLFDILKNPFNYEWEVQGLGMLRTYLNKDTRFQIWNKDLIVEDVTDVHTHPWDFISVILQGKITNHIYKEYSEQVDNSKKYFRCLITTGEDAYVKEKNEVYLLKYDKNTYSGNFYMHKKHVPHKITFKDGTITVLNKFNKNDEDETEKNVKYSDNHITVLGQDKKSSEAYTYVKDGKDWVSAMPRPAKDYEIYDTIKKALECYNNEKSKNSFGRGFSFPLHAVIIKEKVRLKVKVRIFKNKNLKFKQKRFICATTYIRNPIWS